MNFNLIPVPSAIRVNDQNVIINRKDLYLSDQLRQYVKKADEVICETGTIPVDYRICETLGTEAYRLTISADGVLITASAPNGVYYALVTLSQLFQSPTI